MNQKVKSNLLIQQQPAQLFSNSFPLETLNKLTDPQQQNILREASHKKELNQERISRRNKNWEGLWILAK